MATQTALAKAVEKDNATFIDEPTEEITPESASAQIIEPITETTGGTAFDLSIPNTYSTHYGEHPFCLALRFDNDPHAILSVNGLTKEDQVNPDDILKIPIVAIP